ncbi:hypothetical protein Tco_1473719 [Tanacetum coccineum]
MKNDNMIAPGMFRINPSNTSRKDKFVPINKVRASVRTNPIIVSQSHVITKKDVNSDSNVTKIVYGAIDWGCSKHSDQGVVKHLHPISSGSFFLGTVHFGNDHTAAILGFGDLQWGNILITRVYFVEGLGHNLFSVGQICGFHIKVALKEETHIFCQKP